ncbi:BlaI/MecI/CopY family transcriptional regulator [Streptomyces puniciscabiei]|uniref:BlaI/MecI/CopY family transcriptional regulator n=1 Tax=Streptomyces puniciscabiei TaxID=164348 RepID=UPI00331B18CF
MPEPTAPVTELTSQYVSQVTNDLEHNVKEQERITAEIAALQEQLAALQHDQTILVNMRQALGVAASAGAPAPAEGAVVPAPRKKTTTVSDKRRAPKKAAVPEPSGRRRQAAKKPAAQKAPAAKKTTGQSAQPTLIELVRRHLAEQQEPRSAAEVAEALGKAHPGREIQTKVIRTTLENLVARNAVQRSKQGSSVFYTLATASDSAAADTKESGPDAAE